MKNWQNQPKREFHHIATNGRYEQRKITRNKSVVHKSYVLHTVLVLRIAEQRKNRSHERRCENEIHRST